MIFAALALAEAVGTRAHPIKPETPVAQRLLQGNITDDDYPHRLLQRDPVADVSVKILISPKGRVTDCHGAATDQHPDLAAYSCLLIIKRFRYRPYKMANGPAVWVADEVLVHWRPPN